MIYFLLPAYNEEKAIRTQLLAIQKLAKTSKYSYTVVVVDDGSRDKTGEIVRKTAQEMPVILLEHNINKGVGQAFRTGFKKLMELTTDDDIVITMDADNTQDLASVRLMVKRIEEGYELAIGSIFAAGGMMIGVSFFRRILSLGCNKIYQIFFPVRGIREYTGFYRGYAASSLKVAFEKYGPRLMESDGFCVMAELLIKLRSIPVLMVEVPMILRYDYKRGGSKIKILPTILDHLSIIARNMIYKGI